MEQEPVPSPSAQPTGDVGEKNNSKLIVVVVVFVAVLVIGWLLKGLFSPERMIERAIEQNTGGDVDIDLADDGMGKTTITTDEGTFEYSTGGDVSLPDTWPSDLPVMDGGAITYVGSANPAMGQAGAVVMFTTKDSVDAVTAYYTDALTNEGWTIEGTMRTGDMTIISATKGERGVGISIGAGDDGTAVTISGNI